MAPLFFILHTIFLPHVWNSWKTIVMNIETNASCHLTTCSIISNLFSFFIDCSFVLCSVLRLVFDWLLAFSSSLVCFRFTVYLSKWILLKFLLLLCLIKKSFKWVKFLDVLLPPKSKINWLINVLSPSVWYCFRLSKQRAKIVNRADIVKIVNIVIMGFNGSQEIFFFSSTKSIFSFSSSSLLLFQIVSCFSLIVFFSPTKKMFSFFKYFHLFLLHYSSPTQKKRYFPSPNIFWVSKHQ